MAGRYQQITISPHHTGVGIFLYRGVRYLECMGYTEKKGCDNVTEKKVYLIECPQLDEVIEELDTIIEKLTPTEAEQEENNHDG